MKSEDQNVEYKKSWQDEYLKWICGFANADGGRMFIGILDDKLGNRVVGVEGWKKLLEDIPNQMRDTVGSLPESWSVKTLLGKHNSRPANPTIAGCIYLTGLIETWGRGIEKVKAECRKHGCPAPFYEVNAGEPGDLLVRIDAAPDALVEEEGAPDHGTADTTTQTATATTTGTTTQTTTQTTIQTTMQIGGVTQTVLDLLHAEPTISADEAAQKLMMKRDTFYYHVKILRKVVGLKHVGGTKRGRWECLS